ncbi:TrmH family RNA methyltransferase [Timonella sp. A28]|uniref:TrmH family RNA methyltransferase n=1 Tax=Timonella sp. A28 TaxID=3442640 RepID=UPI003EBC9D70
MTELTNPRSDRVKTVRALAGRSSRIRYGQYLVEGPQGVREAVNHAAESIRDIYVTEAAEDRYPDIFSAARRHGLFVHTCTPEVLHAMSTDAQGMLAVVRTPETALTHLTPEYLRTVRSVAVLCQVRDPGNAGTMIRAADAAGADLVILTEDSVDVFNPKVVRSTAGSLFHLSVITNASIEETAQALKAAGIQLLAADGYGTHDLDDLLDIAHALTDNADEPDAPNLSAPTAWLFGNEAAGLSAQEKELADASVRVPLRGKAESLNVATAATVCLYATSRAQR